MSKERLKEIQEKYDMWADDFNLDPQEIEWLIKQAERVQELEEAIADYAYEIGKRKRALNKKNEQNKRYREQLELIRKDTFYENHEFVSVRHLIRKRVDKALKGE